MGATGVWPLFQLASVPQSPLASVHQTAGNFLRTAPWTFLRDALALGYVLLRERSSLAAYAWLGRCSRVGNIACLVALPVLMVWSLVCDPLYTGMFFLAIAVFMGGILLGSETREVAIWRIGWAIAPPALETLTHRWLCPSDCPRE